jgi:hypothetical protein
VHGEVSLGYFAVSDEKFEDIFENEEVDQG